jgi:hypothetical protein
MAQYVVPGQLPLGDLPPLPIHPHLEELGEGILLVGLHLSRESMDAASALRAVLHLYVTEPPDALGDWIWGVEAPGGQVVPGELEARARFTRLKDGIPGVVLLPPGEGPSRWRAGDLIVESWRIDAGSIADRDPMGVRLLGNWSARSGSDHRFVVYPGGEGPMREGSRGSRRILFFSESPVVGGRISLPSLIEEAPAAPHGLPERPLEIREPGGARGMILGGGVRAARHMGDEEEEEGLVRDVTALLRDHGVTVPCLFRNQAGTWSVREVTLRDGTDGASSTYRWRLASPHAGPVLGLLDLRDMRGVPGRKGCGIPVLVSPSGKRIDDLMFLNPFLALVPLDEAGPYEALLEEKGSEGGQRVPGVPGCAGKGPPPWSRAHRDPARWSAGPRAGAHGPGGPGTETPCEVSLRLPRPTRRLNLPQILRLPVKGGDALGENASLVYSVRTEHPSGIAPSVQVRFADGSDSHRVRVKDLAGLDASAFFNVSDYAGSRWVTRVVPLAPFAGRSPASLLVSLRLASGEAPAGDHSFLFAQAGLYRGPVVPLRSDGAEVSLSRWKEAPPDP